MKRLCLRAMCLLFVGVTLSDAVANVTIISQTHHVWGSYSWAPPLEGAYDYTANHPVSGSVYGTDDLYAYSNTGLMYVDAVSEAVHTHPGAFAAGYADATWIFQPHKSSLLLEIDVFRLDELGDGLFVNNNILVSIEDITAGNPLFYYSGEVVSFPEFNNLFIGQEPYVEIFSVDPTHVYNVNLAIEAAANDDGPWHGNISVAVIPAPSAILLGSIGITLVGWLRRRRTL